MITLGWIVGSLRDYNERSQNSCLAMTHVNLLNALDTYTEQSFLMSVIIKTQNIVRKMPLISLEDRGRAVVSINPGPPKQKTRSIFVFLFFYIFIHFYMHSKVYAQLNFTHF